MRNFFAACLLTFSAAALAQKADGGPEPVLADPDAGTPAPPAPTGATPAPAYTANIDPGLVSFDSSGALTPVAWTTMMVGLQYYLPPTGKVWVSANLSRASSDNSKSLGAANKVFTRSLWADFNLFVDRTPAVRLGAEYAWFNHTYADGTNPQNHRVQLSAFDLF